MTFKSLDATVRIFHIACLCARVYVGGGVGREGTKREKQRQRSETR